VIACYDLSRCPPTYDAVAFLALAELERQRTGSPNIDVVILPGPVDGFRRDNLWPHDIASRRQLRDNVLIPLMHLLPKVTSVSLRNNPSPHSGQVEGWGRGEYLVGLPNILRALKSNCRPLRGRQDTQEKFITFTLREAEHHRLRNSRTGEWIVAAHRLISKGYHVVIIRDTSKVDHRLPDGIRHNRMAAFDLGTRASLYASSCLNVGVSNGPMWMSIFMDAPTLMLRPTTNEAGGCYDDTFFAQYGVKRGDQLPNSPPHQRLVWEEDYCDMIVQSVEDML
jgi:hypothetical protein